MKLAKVPFALEEIRTGVSWCSVDQGRSRGMQSLSSVMGEIKILVMRNTGTGAAERSVRHSREADTS